LLRDGKYMFILFRQQLLLMHQQLLLQQPCICQTSFSFCW
jgi:hypothetical protein